MIGFLSKFSLGIMSNPASIIFVIGALATCAGVAYKWKQNYDEGIVLTVIAEQERQTTMVVAAELESRIANQEKDQAAMLNLTRQGEAATALADQAKLELEEFTNNEQATKCGAWSTTAIPVFPKRVLREYIRQVLDPTRLYGGCTGIAAGCAAARLRDALDGKVDKRVRVPGKTSD